MGSMGDKMISNNNVQINSNELLKSCTDKMQTTVMLGRCQRFLNWLEYAVFCNPDERQPSAVEIYATFKKMTGLQRTESERTMGDCEQ